jgi:CspA family cold shock protein
MAGAPDAKPDRGNIVSARPGPAVSRIEPWVRPPGIAWRIDAIRRRPRRAEKCCNGPGQSAPCRATRRFRRQEMLMSTGTVKWFNPTKGYGFIQPQGGGQDVFVHISAVERAGLSTLNEGQQVEYEVVSNRGKSSAENLKVK